MGIPKFYRWLSERYPCINAPVASYGVPQMDNLYLDLNGVLHNCTHANDEGVSGIIDEQEVMAKIFHYIDVLFKMVMPNRVFYIAIDGVAPRAKMNQQRSRRFRSAKDRLEAVAKARDAGEEVDEKNQFDSNCITPGTTFMERVSKNLQFFINKKVSDDEAYKHVTVILSGHEVPGEGEHKIMEYIRQNRHQKDFSPNTRHCLYGLDADLIMLSLITHEPHFCLLREVVKYDGKTKGQPVREVLQNPTDKGFVVLHIGLLRDYLNDEFSCAMLKSDYSKEKAERQGGQTDFVYDFERVIDDFILLCMLVGNDFLPSLPTLDINEGALNKLLEIYKVLIPNVGYITSKGAFAKQGMPFELLMRAIGQLETETLTKRAEDADKFAEKRQQSKKSSSSGFDKQFKSTTDISNLKHSSIEDSHAMNQEPKVVEEGATMMSADARQLLLSGNPNGHALWRHRWYSTKLQVKTTEGIISVVHSYIEAIQWVLQYYVRGCISWNWFYPFHFAPLASDLINIAHHVNTTGFSLYGPLGRPFLPFEQLLSVLPEASSSLLPEPYRKLMTDNITSPLHDFYPKEFAIDMEGKRADWEGICLISFIDERRLIEAARAIWEGGLLSESEKRRNAHGYILIFRHNDQCNHSIPSPLPRLFGTLSPCKTLMKAEAPLKPLAFTDVGFSSGLRKGVKLGLQAPSGFSSLRSLVHTSRLAIAGVNVFGQASKRESLVLELKALGNMDITAEIVAEALIGLKCSIGWPHLKEAIVTGVSDSKTVVTLKNGVKMIEKQDNSKTFSNDAERLRHEMFVEKGIDVGTSLILLHTRAVEGIIRHLDGSIHKRFSKEEELVPFQSSVKCQSDSGHSKSSQPLISEFPLSSTAILLSKVYYGSFVSVKSIEGERLTIEINNEKWNYQLQQQQHAKSIINGIQSRFFKSGEVARKLGISPRALGQITSKMTVRSGDSEFDLGINVRDAKKGYCVPDLAKLSETRTRESVSSTTSGHQNVWGTDSSTNASKPTGGWMYSDRCLQFLQRYKSQFPVIFKLAEMERVDSSSYNIDLLIGTSPGNIVFLSEVQKWLKKEPLSRRPLVELKAQVASEQAIQKLQLGTSHPTPLMSKQIELENVHPGLLMKPIRRGSIAEGLVGGTFNLGDVVVVAVDDEKIPFGCSGVIVGVHGTGDNCAVRNDC